MTPPWSSAPCTTVNRALGVTGGGGAQPKAHSSSPPNNPVSQFPVFNVILFEIHGVSVCQPITLLPLQPPSLSPARRKKQQFNTETSPRLGLPTQLLWGAGPRTGFPQSWFPQMENHEGYETG